MGFLSKILGGDEAKTSSKNTIDPYAPTKEATDALAAGLIPAYEESKRVIDEGTPGDFVADLTGDQLAAMDSLITGEFLQPSISASQGMIGQGQNVFNQGLAGLTDIASGANQIGVDQDIFDQFYNEDLLQGQIDAIGSDISRTFQEQDLTGIDRRFQSLGGAGSSRAGVAEGIAQRGREEQLGNAANTLRSNMFNQANQAALGTSAQRQQSQQSALQNLLGTGMGQQQFGIGSAATLGQQGAENALNASTIGQQQSQAEIQGLLEKLKLDASLPFLPLQNLQGVTMPLATSFGETTGTGTTKQDQGILGKVAPIAGAVGSIFSDRRLKTKVTQLGEVFGLPYYKWEWSDTALEFVGDQVPYGWMAQEVQAKYPSAVSTNDNGYLQIDKDEFIKEIDKEMANV